MNLIVITKPDFFPGESEAVNSLFGCGMPKLHLRKPGADELKLRAWLKSILPEYRNRIVLHDHFGLCQEFNLGGIHLNSRNPSAPEGLLENCPSLTLSCSCHSLQEVQSALGKKEDGGRSCDYVFLSPIFDSISKQGYGKAFTSEELQNARDHGLIGKRTYALGGVELNRLPALRTLGFGGAAVLGALWNAPDREHYLRLLLEECSLG